jgi:hypothetical protein
MNCGGSRGPAATVRCGQCSTTITAAPGARAVHCTQCSTVTRVAGCGRRRPGTQVAPPTRPSPAFRACRSKKRAVLIGIKYTCRRASELRGPINDVKCMKDLLIHRFGFSSDAIIVLTGNFTRAMRQHKISASVSQSNIYSINFDQV